MKKLVIGMAAIMSIVVAHAQKNVSLGFNGGFGHTAISGGTGNNKYQPAGNAGLSLVYSANEHLGFGADLKYSIEGGRKASGNTEEITRLNYLRHGIKAMYFFNDHGDRIRPKVAIGPSIGLLVGGKQHIEVNNHTVSQVTDVKDITNSIDLGLAASAGLHYRLIQNTWLTFDVNYYHGLLDVYDNNAREGKNRNVGMNLGLAFGIGTHNK